MHHFSYKDGSLFAEDVNLSHIADTVGTPTYVYSTATITRHAHVLQNAFASNNVLIAYSVKANGNLAVLRHLGQLGCGADIVSVGELRRALHAGIPAKKIVFSGVGKTKVEMAEALTAGIHTFNVESVSEITALNSVASDLNKMARIALRVNPDVAAGGYDGISTGKAGDKFGIAWGEAHAASDLAKNLSHVTLVGLDVHIGSQITDIAPMKEAFERVMMLMGALNDAGHNITQLDFGGGLGIPYGDETTDIPAPSAYAEMIGQVAAGFKGQIILEPGRVIMGNAGVLLTEIVYVKPAVDRTFLILDTGMNDLMRPALYGAKHEFMPLNESGGVQAKFDIVGPVCESTDVFGRGVSLPTPIAGDRVAIMSAGAYGSVLSSQYNARPLVPEVLVDGDKFAIVRKRPTFEESIALEEKPPWMA